MTAGAPFPQHAEPYTWDDNQSSPQEIVRLWTDVGNGIDKSQTGELCSGGHFPDSSHFLVHYECDYFSILFYSVKRGSQISVVETWDKSGAIMKIMR